MERATFELIKQLRHEIHQNPELSMEEHETRRRLMDFLRQHTKLEVVDRGLWFYVCCHGDSDLPSVAFRTELDALPVMDDISAEYVSKIPGWGHKCGHDGHMAAMCGLAMELDAKGSSRDVYMIFQPGEEIGAGGADSAKLLTEKQISYVYGWHNHPEMPKGMIQTMEGTICYASKGMILEFEGVPSHASMPEAGRCPAFAIAKIINAIPQLTDRARWKGEVFCTVIQVDVGEPAFGTQASRGRLLLTIRGQYEQEMDALQEALESLAAAYAEQDGLTWKETFCDVFPETSNASEAVEKIFQAAEALGLPYRVCPNPDRGSDDFGYYPKLACGAMFEIGSGEDCPPIHTVHYDFPDDLLPIAVDMMLQLTK